MPPLSRWFIKSSLVYLIATFITGVLAASELPLNILPGSGRLSIIYYHLFMLGWVSQLIFGVANWMFPVYSREAPRRSERLGWISYALLNGGLVLLVVGEWIRAPAVTPAGAWIVTVASALLWIAGVAFVANTWGRIKGH